MYPTSLVGLQHFQVEYCDIYRQVKTFVVVMGDAVVCTNKVFFICICRNKEIFSEIFV